MKCINKLFENICTHDFIWLRNIYGDEINLHDGKRSIWCCSKCGKVEYRDELHFKPDKSFVNYLDRLYNIYYENRYKEWCKEHGDTLQCCINQMCERANSGLAWFEINILCDNDKNDKYYYEKFFEELGLKVKAYTDQKEYTKLTNVRFTLKWNQ